ncbi:MAG: hypothetical protein QXV17_13915 [Candidatus Micrarchaeaceae archaeon]
MTNEIEEKRPEACKFFNGCSASLCPLDSRVSEKIWLPEESDKDEICRNKEFAGLQFIKTQKKVARAIKRRNERDDYFSYEMVNRNIVVKSGIRGILEPPDTVKDPMKWYQDKERKWILIHPEISKQRIEDMKERGRKSIGFIQKHIPHPSISEMIDLKGDTTRQSHETSKKSVQNGRMER